MSLTVEHQGRPVELKPIQFVNQHRVDQVPDACRHIRHAATLGLPQLKPYAVTEGKCIIVGGAPSAPKHLRTIRALADDPQNAVFALNYTHNWLIDNGIVPKGCLMFEIDVDPTKVLDAPNPKVNYFVCSLCHPTTFEGLEGCHVTVWHASGEGQKVEVVQEEFGPDALLIGGGCTTFIRTIGVALALGFRKFEIFGCDSSFPDDAASTHFEGYPADTTPADGIDVWVENSKTNELRKFRTCGYLVQQAEHFKQFCQVNKAALKFLRVHGDGLLRFIHEGDFPEFYS